MDIEIKYDPTQTLLFKSFGVDENRLKDWDELAHKTTNVDELIEMTIKYAENHNELCYFMTCCGEIVFKQKYGLIKI